jgi:hypothetical protein
MALRIALLESLTSGEVHLPTIPDGNTASSSKLPKSSTTLLLRSHNANTEFLQSIQKYKSIVQFVNEYKDNKIYLVPSDMTNESGSGARRKIADSEEGGFEGLNQDNKDDRDDAASAMAPLLSTQSIISLLVESAPDLRQLERDLRMCESHQERNTARAGKLAGECVD